MRVAIVIQPTLDDLYAVEVATEGESVPPSGHRP
jgi:hypothetical protein